MTENSEEPGHPRHLPPVPEPLIAPAIVRLFGREFDGLELGRTNPPSGADLQTESSRPNPTSPIGLFFTYINNALRTENSPKFARIYGFSFMGSYFPLQDLPILLVNGPGDDVPTGFVDSLQRAGFAHSGEFFLGGIKVWQVDYMDIAVRIDLSIGWLQEIVMSRAMAVDDGTGPTDRPGMNGRAQATGGGGISMMAGGISMMRRNTP